MEWEVYDESKWTLELALEWDYLPQPDNPGLIFVSRGERRRLWPCPAEWAVMTDADLAALLPRARAIV